jgi:hypothetical protein
MKRRGLGRPQAIHQKEATADAAAAMTFARLADKDARAGRCVLALTSLVEAERKAERALAHVVATKKKGAEYVARKRTEMALMAYDANDYVKAVREEFRQRCLRK